VLGEAFGLVQYGPQYPTWSLTLLDWVERTIADAVNTSLDAALLCRLWDLARDHTALLDEITCPQLLHGDLWLFNLLIERTKEGPRIVGVLDADRGSWGDPLADWTFFLLSRRARPQEQALFWQAYENVTSSETAVMKARLSPVVALDVPVLGSITDAKARELQAVEQLWPDVPHQVCQFHALREASCPAFAACASGDWMPNISWMGVGRKPER
jgi:Phosphotransferase enzyme family